MSGALLVAGTTSDAGKSVLVAGLCRWLARRGVRVAPYKAQNMSLHSMVTADGGEIGRAQAMQAAAARIAPEAAMNPVLLKPGGDRQAQVVLLGRPVGELTAGGPRPVGLREATLDALAGLRSRYDVVVCEGAGSPAEVNLRAGDLANMGLARAADLPVLVVGDIDRGGLLAHLAGTLAALDPADQRHVAGFVVNKFRGDAALLAPGLDWVAARTGRPCLGVLPWRDGLWLDVEDSLDLQAPRPGPSAPVGRDVLRIAVLRLPRMSNVTDVDPLSAEPGVLVRYADWPAELADADLVLVPGSRATVRDLDWLRGRGLDEALRARAAAGRPVLGICGGLQLLGERIDDRVESRAGEVNGLGLLPVRTSYAADKLLGLPAGTWRGQAVTAYEIHHGRVTVGGGEPFLDGCRVGAVWGTSWHGVFENDGFRRAFLTEVAAAAGRDWRPGAVRFADVREARLDALGDLVEQHLDTDAVLRLIEGGVPPGLPTVQATLQRNDAYRAEPVDLRHHGDAELAPGLLDLAVNVRLPGPPRWLRDRLAAALDRLGGYPDPAPATAAVARRHGRPADEVLVTAGAAEAFTLLARALRPVHPVCVHPSFTEPEAALRSAGYDVTRLVLDPPYTLDPGAVPEAADLVVLGNPTNPTGVLHDPAAVVALARPGRILVVDEAFADTVPGEPASLAGRRDLPGLVVVRSLTKTWGLAGLRVGYLLAAPELVRVIAAGQPPWAVSTLALVALEACCAPGAVAEAEAAAAEMAGLRADLAAGLAAVPGVRVAAASVTSYLLLEVADGARVRQRLRAAGIAVRRGDTFPGLGPDHLRVAVRDAVTNRRTVAAFAAALRSTTDGGDR